MNEINFSFFSDPFIRPSEPYTPTHTPLNLPSIQPITPESTPEIKPSTEATPQIAKNPLDLDNAQVIVYRSANPTSIAMGPQIKIPILNLEIKQSEVEGGFAINCVSTYPTHAPFAPIADRFEIRFIKDCFTLTLTDGCGLHPSSRLAPKAAIEGFWKYLAPKIQNDPGQFDVHKIANYLKSAIRAAHYNIYWDALCRSQEGFKEVEFLELNEAHTLSEEELSNIADIKKALSGDLMTQRALVEKNIETKFYEDYAGATTFLCAMLVKSARNVDFPYYLVAVNLGDSQGFILREGKLLEMTKDTRKDLSNVRDPGGKMGLCSPKPLRLDDRNMQYSLTPCKPGDMLLFMTDGVLDNLQPERLKLHPKGSNTPFWIQDQIRKAAGFNAEEMQELLEVLDFEESSWKDLDLAQANEKAARFVNQFLEKLTANAPNAEAANARVIEFCQKITEGHREEKSASPYISEFEKPLGKPDHTTCLTYKIS